MQTLMFFGSDSYSAIVLDSLISAKPTPTITVVTDPKVGGTPVENLANAHNLNISYYPSNPDGMITFIATLKNTPNPLGLCASFDHLLPQNVIEVFGGNLYNLHPSLLPQYRNVSPVQYAIALGDTVTGITLFRISSGIDNGQIIAQAVEEIREGDTTTSLTPRLFELGAELFVQALKNEFTPTRKPESRNTGELVFTKRLTRDSGFIEWEVLSKLLKNEPIEPSDTTNELLRLRLGSDLKGSAQPADPKAERSDPHGVSILHDLVRSLSPWPTIWSLVPSKKGELRVTLESVTPEVKLKIAGKPKPISYADFTQYYL